MAVWRRWWWVYYRPTRRRHCILLGSLVTFWSCFDVVRVMDDTLTEVPVTEPQAQPPVDSSLYGQLISPTLLEGVIMWTLETSGMHTHSISGIWHCYVHVRVRMHWYALDVHGACGCGVGVGYWCGVHSTCIIAHAFFKFISTILFLVALLQGTGAANSRRFYTVIDNLYFRKVCIIYDCEFMSKFKALPFQFMAT